MDPYRTEDLKSVQEERDAAKRPLEDLVKTIDRRIWRYVGTFIVVTMFALFFNTVLVLLTVHFKQHADPVVNDCSAAVKVAEEAVDGEQQLLELAKEAIHQRDICRGSR